MLTVQRLTCTPLSTSGELLIDGQHECFTLEPRADRSQGKPYAIPTGLYKYTIAPSQHFGRNVIRLEDVPGFDAIEVHPGNFPRDTHGCTLVGTTHAANFVGHSNDAFNALLGKIPPVGLINYVDPPAAPAAK